MNDEDEQINISRKELLERLNDLVAVAGGEIYAPFSQKMLYRFNELFMKEYD